MAVSTISQAGLDSPITLTSPVINTPTMGGSVITSGTSQASTSGTSIDFTSIPSWVKRITVMFSSMSTSGTSNYLIQIGSGSITSTGYLSGSGYVCTSVNNTTTGTTGTTGFVMYNGSAANVLYGACILINVSGNTWDSTHTIGSTSGINGIMSGGGVLTLAGALDRVRITTVNGTDTFDAGSINILYE